MIRTHDECTVLIGRADKFDILPGVNERRPAVDGDALMAAIEHGDAIARGTHDSAEDEERLLERRCGAISRIVGIHEQLGACLLS